METHMIVTSNLISADIQDEVLEMKDPLGNLDTYEEAPKYYRLNETIFSEPITIQHTVDTEADNEIIFIDNLMVQRKPGKRNKYYIDVDKNSLSPKCPQTDCNKTFSTTTLLRAHVRRVHCAERNRYVCERCGSGFSARYLLQRHAAVHDKSTIQCTECGRALSTRTNMSAHLRRHATVRPRGLALRPRVRAARRAGVERAIRSPRRDAAV